MKNLLEIIADSQRMFINFLRIAIWNLHFCLCAGNRNCCDWIIDFARNLVS